MNRLIQQSGEQDFRFRQSSLPVFPFVCRILAFFLGQGFAVPDLHTRSAPFCRGLHHPGLTPYKV